MSVGSVTGPEWVVGLNHGAHDAAAALVYHGELVVTVEQERLSRRKRAPEESPAAALRFCLDHAGIALSDVELVALGSDHNRLARWLGLDPAARAAVLPYDRPDRLFPAEMFGSQQPGRIVPVDHHVAHAASAFWPSGWPDCALLVVDAMGESTATSIAVGRAGRVEVLEAWGVDSSLGFYYEAASEFAGLGRQDAGKLMGLAAYGRPRYDTGLRFADGRLEWRGVDPPAGIGRRMIEHRSTALQAYFARTCFPYAPRRGEDIMAYADFAASAQRNLEEVVLGLAARAAELTGSTRLGIAGGVGLNCTANGRIADSGLFEDVWVQPMSHDAGVALGSALAAAAAAGTDLRGRSTMPHAYWGPGIDAAEAAAALDDAALTPTDLPSRALTERVVEIIAGGGIVAWAQGRAEVGPRSLGARSLLGDPRSRRTLVRLNNAKGREMWRPLAPSVPIEHFGDWFDGVPNPFMIVAAQVRPEVRTVVPAVVHVDGSARPQAVDRRHNPAYHDLLTAFGRRTEVPVLVNTSLNVAEEPVASSARDVVATFLKSGADAMVLDRYLVMRP